MREVPYIRSATEDSQRAITAIEAEIAEIRGKQDAIQGLRDMITGLREYL